MGRRTDYVSNFMEAMRGGPPVTLEVPEPPQQTPEQVRFEVKLERVEAYLKLLRQELGDPEDPFDRSNLRDWIGDESAFQLAAAHATLMVLGEHKPYLGIWARGCRVCHVHGRMRASLGSSLPSSEQFPCTTVTNVVAPFIAVLEAKDLDR